MPTPNPPSRVAVVGPERGSGDGMKPGASPFKGNKAALPAKPCAACGRTMSWRRAWAKNWDDVKYCSKRCRRARARDE